MSGRPPKPTALRVLEGVRGHRPLRREPIAQGTPQAPRWLKGDARQLWTRTVPELQRMGVIGKIDECALTMLCQTWSLWLDVERELADPEQRMDDRLHRQSSRLKRDLLAMLTQFGMTPVARARLATPQSLTDDTLGGLLR